jgi:hypothetical protein
MLREEDRVGIIKSPDDEEEDMFPPLLELELKSSSSLLNKISDNKVPSFL